MFCRRLNSLDAVEQLPPRRLSIVNARKFYVCMRMQELLRLNLPCRRHADDAGVVRPATDQHGSHSIRVLKSDSSSLTGHSHITLMRGADYRSAAQRCPLKGVLRPVDLNV